MFRVIPIQSGKRSLVRFTALKNSVANGHSAAPAVSGHHAVHEFDQKSVYPRIGAREIVGYGINGQPQYFDHPLTPLPSIRWREDTAELKSLREKAKGDWSKLTVEEKRILYRADFRSTIAETSAPNGEWKFTAGFVLGLMGASIWIYYLVRQLIYDYPVLETNTLEHQARMLERMIAEGKGRVHGVAADWDYEKGDWKSK